MISKKRTLMICAIIIVAVFILSAPVIATTPKCGGQVVILICPRNTIYGSISYYLIGQGMIYNPTGTSSYPSGYYWESS